ncbi:MAG TPA: hypothetical protein DCW90_16185 [Lachnospiraceae bacterium]|nr:hypothetical protein [Lachnospiraceae bacterium]
MYTQRKRKMYKKRVNKLYMQQTLQDMGFVQRKSSSHMVCTRGTRVFNSKALTIVAKQNLNTNSSQKLIHGNVPVINNGDTPPVIIPINK